MLTFEGVGRVLNLDFELLVGHAEADVVCIAVLLFGCCRSRLLCCSRSLSRY